jgi:hypothetical protein
MIACEDGSTTRNIRNGAIGIMYFGTPRTLNGLFEWAELAAIHFGRKEKPKTNLMDMIASREQSPELRMLARPWGNHLRRRSVTTWERIADTYGTDLEKLAETQNKFAKIARTDPPIPQVCCFEEHDDKLSGFVGWPAHEYRRMLIHDSDFLRSGPSFPIERRLESTKITLK